MRLAMALGTCRSPACSFPARGRALRNPRWLCTCRGQRRLPVPLTPCTPMPTFWSQHGGSATPSRVPTCLRPPQHGTARNLRHQQHGKTTELLLEDAAHRSINAFLGLLKPLSLHSHGSQRARCIINVPAKHTLLCLNATA